MKVKPPMRKSLVLLPGLVLAGFLLGLAASAQEPSRSDENLSGSISGRITVSQKGAAGIGVELLRIDASSARRISVARVATDRDGRYEFKNVAPGRYDVVPVAPALVVPNEVQAARPGKSVTVAPGGSVAGIDFDLVPAGKVTGRVVDLDGQPVAGESVTLHQISDDGTTRPLSLRSVPRTDAQGVYVASGVPPGRYVVSVGSLYGFDPAGTSAGRHGVYALTFHPHASDPAKASVIEVPAGGEIKGVDITVGPPRKTYEISGRVVYAETGRPISRVGLILVAESEDGRSRSTIGGGWRSSPIGEFKIAGAVPGRYLIYPESDTLTNTYGDPVRFEIKDENISGLEIRMQRAAVISGTVEIEGADQAESSVKLARLGISASVASDEQPGPGSSATRINSDGTFRIKGLRPGKVSINVFPISRTAAREFAILGMERNGVVLRDGLEIGRGEEITGLRVVLGAGSGAIRGQVKVENGPLEGIRLYVLWRRVDGEPDRYWHTELDAEGRFVIEKLTAGDYELMIGPMSFYVTSEAGRQTMSRLPTIRQNVTVAPGKEANVTLTLALKK
jgi:5-hydroxyisourate hydrolase-like protein (transthyretin family)